MADAASVFFSLIIIIVLLCGPMLAMLMIIKFIVQFTLGGGLGRLASGMLGAGEQKFGGGLKQKMQERAGRTSYGIRKQLKQQDRTQRQTAHGVSALGGWRGRKIQAVRGVIPGLSQQDQRINQQLMSYSTEDEKKQIMNFDSQHMQALAASKGDVNKAVQYLQARGIAASTEGVGNTAQALSSLGKMKPISQGNTSTLQAIGDLASSRGELLGDVATGDQEMASGFAKQFQQAAAKSGSVTGAMAGGIGIQWGIQARSQGQFSHALEKMPSFSHASDSDLSAIMQQAANRAQQGALGKEDLNQLIDHFAQAEVGIRQRDTAYTRRKQEIIKEGRQNIAGALAATATPGGLANQAANFNLAIDDTVKDLEKRGTTISTSIGK